jgi:hypothetical protein
MLVSFPYIAIVWYVRCDDILQIGLNLKLTWDLQGVGALYC